MLFYLLYCVKECTFFAANRRSKRSAMGNGTDDSSGEGEYADEDEYQDEDQVEEADVSST